MSQKNWAVISLPLRWAIGQRTEIVDDVACWQQPPTCLCVLDSGRPNLRMAVGRAAPPFQLQRHNIMQHRRHSIGQVDLLSCLPLNYTEIIRRTRSTGDLPRDNFVNDGRVQVPQVIIFCLPFTPMLRKCPCLSTSLLKKQTRPPPFLFLIQKEDVRSFPSAKNTRKISVGKFEPFCSECGVMGQYFKILLFSFFLISKTDHIRFLSALVNDTCFSVFARDWRNVALFHAIEKCYFMRCVFTYIHHLCEWNTLRCKPVLFVLGDFLCLLWSIQHHASKKVPVISDMEGTQLV